MFHFNPYYDQLCITGDCVEIIAKYLDPIDIINICKVYPKNYKRLYNHLLESVGRNIDNYFRSFFGEKYEQFKQCMISDEGVVSGSFILQMILNENWQNSDVDIYTDFRKLTYFYGKLELFLYDNCVNKNVGTDETDVECHIGRYICAFVDRDTIRNVRDYRIKGKIFQVIELDSRILVRKNLTTISKFIDESFDFDICKNTFYYDKDGYHVGIKNLKQIVEKRVGFKIGKDFGSSWDRCIKYQTRGFKFYNELNSDHKFYNRANKLLNMQ